MSIYTSYFANIKNIPSNMVTIAICGKSPDTYTGLEYKKLAPKYGFFMQWKEDHDNDKYIECFEKEVLEPLVVEEVVKDLLLLSGNIKGLNYSPEIVLLCFEHPGKFCHRHLVAEWFEKNGIIVKELEI